MSTMQDRLRAQRDAAAASGAVADDAIRQPVVIAPKPVVEEKKAQQPSPPPIPKETPAVQRPEKTTTRTQGIPISSADDALLDAMESHCRKAGIKMRRTSNISMLTRAGWRLLHDLMERDPEGFAAAIERGRLPSAG